MISEAAKLLLNEIKASSTDYFRRADDSRGAQFSELETQGLIRRSGASMSGSWGGDDDSGLWYRTND